MSSEVTQAQIGVIWGQNTNKNQHRTYLYEIEALRALIPEKNVFEVILGHPSPHWGHSVKKNSLGHPR